MLVSCPKSGTLIFVRSLVLEYICSWRRSMVISPFQSFWDRKIKLFVYSLSPDWKKSALWFHALLADKIRLPYSSQSNRVSTAAAIDAQSLLSFFVLNYNRYPIVSQVHTEWYHDQQEVICLLSTIVSNSFISTV